MGEAALVYRPRDDIRKPVQDKTDSGRGSRSADRDEFNVIRTDNRIVE